MTRASPSMARTHAVTTKYFCRACRASSAVELTGLREPLRQVSSRNDEALRQYREARKQRGLRREREAGDGEAFTILSDEASSLLLHATCPRCGERNPEGVAHLATQRRWTIGLNVALFAALAVGAHYVPWVAVALPALDTLVLSPRALMQMRRDGQPVPWSKVLLGVVLCLASVAIVVLAPSAAPLVPLATLALVLARRPAEEEPWERSEASLKWIDKTPP